MIRSVFTITVLVSSIALASCDQNSRPLTEEEKLIGRAKDAVLNDLKDPTSAQFKDILASISGHCVVGQVLAKNSYGAYDGFTGFVWQNNIAFLGKGPFDQPYFDKMMNCLNDKDKELSTPSKKP